MIWRAKVFFKLISTAKTVLRYAKRNSEKITENARKLKPVFLSLDKLAKIEQTPMPSDYLENAKRWLLLGCEIGQRVGDLLNLTPENLKKYKGRSVIELKQEKTAKRVIVPL